MKVKYPRGELWLGDCFDLLKEVPDKSIGMVFCDLPYGKTNADWDKVLPFEPLWENFERVCREKAAIIFTATQPFTSQVVMSKKEWFRHEWVWDKVRPTGFQNVAYKPMVQHESILVFGSETVSYSPIKGKRNKGRVKQKTRAVSKHLSTQCQPKDGGEVTFDTFPNTILSFTSVMGPKLVHQNQKPTALLAYLIETYTQKDETILDPTCGSGTTAAAAIHTNRRFLCIEKGLEEFEVAKNRIENESGGFDF